MRVGMLVSVLVADAVLGGRPQASSVLVGDLHYIGQNISHWSPTRERGELYIDTEMHYVWGLPSVDFTKYLAIFSTEILRVHITEIIIVESLIHNKNGKKGNRNKNNILAMFRLWEKEDG